MTSVNDVKYKSTPALLKMKVVRVQGNFLHVLVLKFFCLSRCVGELGHWGLGKEELWSICWTVWSICTVSEQVDWFFTWWKSILLSFHLNSVSEGLVGGLFVCFFIIYGFGGWWQLNEIIVLSKCFGSAQKALLKNDKLFWIVLLICLNADTNL